MKTIKAEYIIPKWEWVAEDRNGEVILYTHKPKKARNHWWVRHGQSSVLFSPERDEWGVATERFMYPEISWEDDEPTRIVYEGEEW